IVDKSNYIYAIVNIREVAHGRTGDPSTGGHDSCVQPVLYAEDRRNRRGSKQPLLPCGGSRAVRTGTPRPAYGYGHPQGAWAGRWVYEPHPSRIRTAEAFNAGAVENGRARKVPFADEQGAESVCTAGGAFQSRRGGHARRAHADSAEGTGGFGGDHAQAAW